SRPGTRGWRRRRPDDGDRGRDGSAQDRFPDAPAPRARDPAGLGRRRGGQPHGRGARRRRVRDHADPSHAGADESAHAHRGPARESRNGYDREVRAAIPGRRREVVVTEFATIDEAIEEVRAGRILVVVDDEDRENEGDLLMAADKVTPEAVNFMAKHGRGLICMPMMGDRLDQLQISMMVSDNTAPLGTAFTVSVDARRGVTTGTSAFDRAVTVRTLGDPAPRPDALTRPGHIFPLRAMPGGVLRRAGHTEAAVDLARLAGSAPAGLICEVLYEDGGMARVPDLLALTRRHGLKCITIKDLIEYRIQKEKLVHRAATTRLPTDFGEFALIAYETTVDEHLPLALVYGDVAGDSPVLVRVHS